MTTTQIRERIRVSDIELYVEVRGDGPAVLLVPGAGGDAGQYAELAGELTSGHTVVTYDRRSNSRSPRPDGWESTSVEQQADDAAAILAAVSVGPAAVFGNSTGALIALATALRSPQSVSALVVHEPALMSVLADPGRRDGRRTTRDRGWDGERRAGRRCGGVPPVCGRSGVPTTVGRGPQPDGRQRRGAVRRRSSGRSRHGRPIPRSWRLFGCRPLC